MEENAIGTKNELLEYHFNETNDIEFSKVLILDELVPLIIPSHPISSYYTGFSKTIFLNVLQST